MTSLGGSAFLQALGWAIAGSLWQMALLWGIYQLCFAVWRNIKASVKTLAATLLQFAGFVWFVSSLVSHYWQLKMTPGNLGVVDAVYREGVRPHSHALVYYVNRLMSLSEHYLPYLSGAYLLVLAFLLVRVVKAYRHVQVVRTEGIAKIDAHWRVYVQEMAYRIGIHRTIRVWLSEKIDIPATMGYLKPLILLPIASFNHLSTEQVEAILLHELAHIKRNDYLLNLIITVVDTVLFFNPFAQLIARHIRTERENSCDDFVLQFRYNPHVYASALLSLEQQRLSPELAMAAAGKTDLLERIKRIMNVPSKPMNYGQKLMALLITAGILASLAWLTPENIERKPFLNPIAVLLPTPPPVPVPTGVLSKTSVPHHTRASVIPVAKVTEDVSEGLDNVWSEDNPTKADDDRQAAELAKVETGYLKDSRDRALQALNLAQAQQMADHQKMVLQLSDAAGAFQKMKAFRFGADTFYVKGFNIQMDSLGAQFKTYRLDMGQPGLSVEYGRPRKISARKDLSAVYLTELKAATNRQVYYELRQEQTQERQKVLMLKKINDNLLLINKLAAATGKVKAKAKVLDQPCLEEGTGILADQPGWQVPDAPTGAYHAFSTRAAVVPVAYFAAPAPQARRNATAAGAFRERVTVYQNQTPPQQTGCPDPAKNLEDRAEQSAAAQDQDALRHKVSYVTVNGLVTQLEKDGFIGERGTARIVCDDNTLVVNGEVQTEAIFERYKTSLEGKNFVILATGKVVQVTIK